MKNLTTRVLYCDENITSINIINSGHPPEIFEFNISSYRRLIRNLGRRLYDTPVDIEGKIIPLGTYTARLIKTLNMYMPNPTLSWMQSEDDDLALAILRKAIRWRIQEPDLLHTIYDYLVSAIASRCPAKSDTYYTAGKLTKHAWFNTMLEKHFQRIVSASDIEATHLVALQNAFLAGTHPLFLKLRKDIF